MKRICIKTLVAILACMVILVMTATASTGSVTKELWYKNIKITLNDEEVVPTDANGRYVEPFTIEGTTYLPVRGIANALGMDVDWDGNTNTVKLSNDVSEITIPETIVVDRTGLRIVAKEFYQSMDSVKLVLEVTNNLNMNLTPVFTISLNDIEFGTAEMHLKEQTENHVEFPAKKTVTAEIEVSQKSVECVGINEVLKIDLSMEIFDDSFNEYCSVANTTIRTSADNSYNEVNDNKEAIIYNKGSIKVTVKGMEKKDELYQLLLFVENDSDRKIECFADECQFWVDVNGKQIPEYFFLGLFCEPRKKSLNSLLFKDSDVDGNSIEKVESIKITSPYDFQDFVTIYIDENGNVW